MEKINEFLAGFGFPSWAVTTIKLLILLLPFSFVFIVLYKIYRAGVSVFDWFGSTQDVEDKKKATSDKFVIPVGLHRLKSDSIIQGLATTLYDLLQPAWFTYEKVFTLLKPLNSADLVQLSKVFGVQKMKYGFITAGAPMTLPEMLLYKYSGTDLANIKFLFKFTNIL